MARVAPVPTQMADLRTGAGATSSFTLISSVAFLLACTYVAQSRATVVAVKHREGVSHGFIVLHSTDGRQLATGDMIQTVEGERVTTEVVLHFKDGSVHNETTVFSQDREFRLISDHLQQYGPSFPNSVDVA